MIYIWECLIFKSNSRGNKGMSNYSLQTKPDMHNRWKNSHDFLFLCQPLPLRAASRSCICWDARHHAGLCPLPESSKNVIHLLCIVTEMNYRDAETQKWNTLLSCLPCLWSWFWRHRTADTPQWRCGPFLWPHAEECCTTELARTHTHIDIHCGWVICMQIHIRTHKKTIIIRQYIYGYTWVPVHIQAGIKCTFTLSLTFRSAPWLFRALTTPRLPPLQAQCMALEPSWNTVGKPCPINSADFRPLEAGALVCEDNLTQSYHHLHKQAMCPHVLLDL